MPPPAFRNALMAAEAPVKFVMLVAVLSQPPQVKSEATTIALYVATLKLLAAGMPASGSMLVNGMPKVVRRPVNSLPWSKLSTGLLGVGAPARAKVTMALIWAIAPVEPRSEEHTSELQSL